MKWLKRLNYRKRSMQDKEYLRKENEVIRPFMLTVGKKVETEIKIGTEISGLSNTGKKVEFLPKTTRIFR